MEFSLNLKVLNDIPFQKYANDFTFIVNGKRHPTPRIIADLLSPKVRKLHFSDESANEFYIDTENGKVTADYFEDFLKLCTNDQINLDLQHQELYSQYFYKLGNANEYLRIQTNISNSISTENAIDKLLTIERITSNISEENDRSSFKNIISFIASHFDEIDKTKLKELTIDDISDIIFSESLKIYEEDSLLSFLLSLYESDHSYSVLFEGILFSNVSETMLEKFMSEIEFEDVNYKIWNSIHNRFLPLKKSTLSRYFEKREKEFKYSNNKKHQFDGILYYLSGKSEGNIHTNGTIEITTNSIYDNNLNNHPKYLVEFDSSMCYWSNDDKDVFICFDFKDKSIKLSEYSLKTCDNIENGSHLKSWVIEVSNDGYNWEVVDRQSNNSILNGTCFTATFKVEKKNNNKFYRYVRLRQTGYSWDDSLDIPNYYFALNLIEFFGKLKENK